MGQKRPGEPDHGVKVTLNDDCSVKETRQIFDESEIGAVTADSVFSAPEGNAGDPGNVGILYSSASCTGHAIVEDPVAIDVTNLSNVINFHYDGWSVWLGSTKVYANPFATSGWYVSYGPVRHSHQPFPEEYELHSFADFENWTWGDDNKLTWADHENRTFAYSDGTCAIIWTTTVGGEDANLLSASGFIHYHSH